MHYTRKKTFRQKLTDYFSSLSSGKTVSILSLLLITSVLPVTVFLTRQLLETKQTAYAAANSSPSVYYGAYVTNDYWNFSGVSSFEADAGKPLAIVMDYQGWGVTDGSQNFTPSWMNQVHAHGSIPLVTWEPWLYSAGINQPAYQLQRIYNGTFDAYITKWAQDAKAWGYPFFLRFAHEMNGNWYPWSEQVNGNQPGDYVMAWRHIHDIFTANGATNVSWVWSPNIEYSYTTPLVEEYPGDSYVDWIGMDGYNWGTSQPNHSWQTFSQVFSQTYTDLQQLAPTKPLMIAETSSAEQGGSKANWITDALTTQLPNNFPNIKAILWFNADFTTSGQADWRIESSSTAQQGFAQAMASSYYASNQFSNLTAAPIVPLLQSSPILTPTPNPAATPTPTGSLSGNLVTNPGCETDTSGWSGYQSTLSRTTAVAHSGVASCNVVQTIGTVYTMDDYPNTVTNPKQGDRYTATAWLRSDAALGKRAWLVIRLSGGANPSKTIYDPIGVSLSTSWQQLTNTVTVDYADRTSLEVYLVQENASAGDSFQADDISLQQILPVTPTPTFTPMPTPTNTPRPTPTFIQIPTPSFTSTPTNSYSNGYSHPNANYP